ncbi:surface lipoprotein assembly modifier [Alsobacter sp. R-9]
MRLFDAVRFLCALTVAGAMAGARPAEAQDAADGKSEMERLFVQILRTPSDLDANLRFAEIAVALKDYEAAIGAYERLLFYNPANGDVQLQLGRLYLQLNSPQMARLHFVAAESSPQSSPSIRRTASAFISQIDNGGGRPFSMYASVGARWQSNANAGPSQSIIRVFGQSQLADQTTTQTPDWNAFALSSMNYAWAFNERGDAVEFNLATYFAVQARITRLDAAIADAQVGPRFALPNDTVPNLSVRPYAIGTYTALGGSTYFSGGGAGFSVRHDTGPIGTFDHFLEYRRRLYQNSEDYPLATEQTGNLWSYTLQTTGTVVPGVRWVGRLLANLNDAQTAFNSFRQVGVEIGFPIEFTGPVTLGEGSWILTPNAGIGTFRYDGPDPSVDPGVTRNDLDWRVGLRLDVPVAKAVGIVTQVGYSVIDSNIVNYDARNLSVSVGTTFRF